VNLGLAFSYYERIAIGKADVCWPLLGASWKFDDAYLRSADGVYLGKTPIRMASLHL